MAKRIDTQARIEQIRLQQQGATPSTPSAGYSSIYLKADGLYLVNDSGQNIGPFITGTAASVGITWTQTLDKDGTTFSGFSGTSGNWFSSGTFIIQTDTSAGKSRARYDTKLATSGVIFEAEMQIRNTGADNRVGLMVGFQGTTAGEGALVYITPTTNAIGVETDSAEARGTFSTTISINTWYKIRLVCFGGRISIYKDGTLIGTTARVGFNDASYVGFYTYQAEGWYRNIKAWNFSLPA